MAFSYLSSTETSTQSVIWKSFLCYTIHTSYGFFQLIALLIIHRINDTKQGLMSVSWLGLSAEVSAWTAVSL